MSDEADAAYFANRAAQERRMADRSYDAGARDAHRQLADLYAGKASRQDGNAIIERVQVRGG